MQNSYILRTQYYLIPMQYLLQICANEFYILLGPHNPDSLRLVRKYIQIVVPHDLLVTTNLEQLLEKLINEYSKLQYKDQAAAMMDYSRRVRSQPLFMTMAIQSKFFANEKQPDGNVRK